MINYDPQKRDLLEQKILGTIITNAEYSANYKDLEYLITVKHGIDNPDYFYSKINKAIFQGMLRCWENEVSPTLLLLMNFRPEEYQNSLENEINYKAYDDAVIMCSIKAGNAVTFDFEIFILKQYIIQDYWNSTAYDVLNSSWDNRDILMVAENIIDGHNLLFEKLTKNFKKDGSGVTVMERAKKEYQDTKAGLITWIPTGIPQYDWKRKGLRNGELTIVAARPSMGKSAVMTAVAKHASLREHKLVCLFSLEVPKQQIMNHIIAAETGFNYEDIKDYNLSEENFAIVLQWYEYFASTCKLKIYDINDARTPNEINDIVKQVEPEFVVVDYLQLCKLDKSISSNRNGNREQEVSEISRSFKLMATEYNIPVMAGAQLSRKVDERPTRRAMLSDLRESGSIEQDADNVWFPFRQAYYDEVNNPTITIPLWQKGNFDMHQAKGRDGGTGHYEFNLDLVTYRFRDGRLDSEPTLEYDFGKPE